jgi:hypothetical protein
MSGPELGQAEIDYIARFGSRCRDCADDGPVCPNTGIACNGYEAAARRAVTALNYGWKHGFLAVPAGEAARGGGDARDRITGDQWVAGRDAFVRYADRYRDARTYELASAIADVAPAEIYKAIEAAAPNPPAALDPRDDLIQTLMESAKRIDTSWTEAFPGGPDGPRTWGGWGELTDETITMWRGIRAAIAAAEAALSDRAPARTVTA